MFYILSAADMRNIHLDFHCTAVELVQSQCVAQGHFSMADTLV